MTDAVPHDEPPVFDAAFRAQLGALFRWRRDVRRFRRDPLAPGTIERLLATASLAPSVGLSQPWRPVLVESKACRDAIRAEFRRCNRDALERQTPDRAALYARLKLAGLDEAPCHLAIFAEPDPAQGHGLGRATMPATVAWSAVLAAHTLSLAARAEGLGVGWVSILDPDTIVAALDVPAHWIFVGYFCVGAPEQDNDVPELEREGWERRRPVCEITLRR